MALINLYPPVIDTYMPAFIIDETINGPMTRIYFSISGYNTLSEILNAQVSIVNQRTNKTVLNHELYTAEIAIKEVHEDISKTGKDRFYIDLFYNDFEECLIDTYYKLQIRFTSVDASYIDSTENLESTISWLSNNLEYFSEWSTVCLIRGIDKPIITITGLNEEVSEIEWTAAKTNLSGSLSFNNTNENELLKEFQFELYDTYTNKLLFESEKQYTSNYINVNSFSYNLPYSFDLGKNYKIVFNYTTNNLYKGKCEYSIKIIQSDVQNIDLILKRIDDFENGRIGIHIIKNNELENFTGSIIIRRTSNESNYSLWEDVHTEELKNALSFDYIWYDYTIKAGTLYNYAVQTIEENTEGRSNLMRFTDPVLVDYEDIFLTNTDNQLRIRLNPNITNFKRNVADTKIETIGSKYPFIIRNGYSGYTQFTVSGLIYADEDKFFLTREECYGKDNLSFYNKYFKNNDITYNNDWIYENKFRNEVIDFLYDDKAKILRSPVEGAFLVRLTDISFSPDKVSNRKYWTFNATAIEIGDYTLDELEKQNLLTNRTSGTTIKYKQAEEEIEE